MAPNNEQHYNTHEYAGDEATRTHRTMQHMPDEDRTTRADLQQYYNQSMATELSPEVRMGDDRAIGDTPNWEAYSSEQLYNFAREGNSPTTADSLGRGFTTGGNNLATAANGLLEAVTMLDGAWSGVAADSARSALAPLAQSAGHAGQTAQLMGVRMSEQSVAASEVMKLPPPQEFNTQQALGALMTGGIAGLQKDMKAQKDAADKVKKEQITYLTAYTSSMSSVDSQTPTFLPPPKGINGGDGGGTKITGGDVLSPTAGRQNLGLDGGTSTGGPSGGWTGAQPGADPGFNGPDTEGGDDSDLPPVGVGTGSGTGASGLNTGPAVNAPSTTAPGMGGTPHTAAPSAGSGGFGPGFGSFGGGGAGGAGSAGAGGSGAGQGPGAGRGGAGPMPGGMGGRGGVGGRGGMGPGGMGAGGKRADGEEDEEHNRPSYLVEGDPEGTFGNDQMTAPSVIGDDNN